MFTGEREAMDKTYEIKALRILEFVHDEKSRRNSGSSESLRPPGKTNWEEERLFLTSSRWGLAVKFNGLRRVDAQVRE